MEEPPALVTRRNCEQLETLARDVQYEARHREAVSEDCFLVTPADNVPARAFPNRVHPVSLRDAALEPDPAPDQGQGTALLSFIVTL
jgi:hypothetical protein